MVINELYPNTGNTGKRTKKPMTGSTKSSKNNFTDNQTLLDLHIFGSKTGSISGLLDSTSTYGGKSKLEDIFRNLNLSKEDITKRLECIDYISRHDLQLDIDKELFDFIETYLAISSVPMRPTWVNAFHTWMNERLKPTNQYYIIRRGILFLFQAISGLYEFAKNNEGSHISQIKQYSDKILEFINSDKLLINIINNNHKKRKRLSVNMITTYDSLFRYDKKRNLRDLLDIVYTLDVYRSVAKNLIQRGFCIPEISEGKPPSIAIEGLFHPFIANPIKNDIELGEGNNVALITGANMSGKSTFMKSFGVAVYLAHIGLPVPASRMVFAMFDGLYTTINLPDNLGLGYSHFYAEVKRVKTIAGHLHNGKKLVVIFDELFRGTNVKDAGDGTFLIVSGLLDRHDSGFMISTHITEVTEQLKDDRRIKFLSFKTEKREDRFINDYKLRPGISNDRFGTEIIRNENILDLLKG